MPAGLGGGNIENARFYGKIRVYRGLRLKIEGLGGKMRFPGVYGGKLRF